MSGLFGDPSADRNAVKSVEWYTPKWVFDALDISFDLDPSSPHDHESFVPADRAYTIFDDGLKQEWFGRVWMNPPYGKETPFWMARMIDHNHGIALVFSRTDAGWFQDALKAATATLLVSGRIEFVPGNENKHKKSRSGAGSAFFAFGEDCAQALEKLSDRGVLIRQTAIAA